MLEKTCKRCGKPKSLQRFPPDPRCNDGRRNVCYDCAAIPKVKPVVPPGCKFCPKCEQPKPIDEFYPSKKHRDGRLASCIPCWLGHYKPSKRTSYTKHKARILAERREQYQANPEPRRLADARYDLNHREERLAANREYYRRNRDRLIEYNQEYRRRFRNSFDYGWTKALPHDRRELKLWKDRTYAEICKQEAIEFIELLEKRLSPVERTILDCLVDANFDATTAADMMSVSIHDFTDTLTAIRQVAVQVQNTEWTPGFWTW